MFPGARHGQSEADDPNDNQGQSRFVRSVIDALSQVVSLAVQTAVACPLIRMYPGYTRPRSPRRRPQAPYN